MNKGSVLVYELVNKPAIRVGEKGEKIYPNCRNQFELVDDIVHDGKQRTIAVVSGEPEIFLDQHQEKDRRKVDARTLVFFGARLYVNPSDVNVVKFLSLSSLSNDNGDNRQVLRKVDDREEAVDRASIQQKIGESIAMIYDEKNWEALKAFTVATSKDKNIDLEDADDKDKTLIRANLTATIRPQTVDSFIDRFKSARINRIYEMRNAIKAGKVVIDHNANMIRFKEGNQEIVSFTDDPAVSLADHTLTSDGARAYSYLMDGMTKKQAQPKSKKSEDLDSLDLKELVNRGIRLEIFTKAKNGFRFMNANVGKEAANVVEHFTKNPDKVETLKALIAKKASK